jgi:cytidylate kinase
MHSSVDLLLDRQFLRWELERSPARQHDAGHGALTALGPLITISREHGSIGVAVADQLARHFHYTLLHRDLVERMVASTGHARRLLEALDGHARSRLSTWIGSMMAGTYVDEGVYLRALLRTIYSIAELGGVVVVGRAANFIVGPDRGFHARVVAPREIRIRAIMERRGIDEREAAHEIDVVDRERSEFVRHMFGRSVDDPVGYDVVVNAGDRSAETVSGWLAEAASEKFERLHLRRTA